MLSLEEVEVGLKGLKVGSEQQQHHQQQQPRKVPSQQRRDGTPFMAEHLEEALTGGSSAGPRAHSRDPDMSAFNKLVSSMKASGTLPTHPKANANNVSVPPQLSDVLKLCQHAASGNTNWICNSFELVASGNWPVQWLCCEGGLFT